MLACCSPHPRAKHTQGDSTLKLIRSRILTLQLLALLLVALISCAAYAGITTRVSVASNGTQGNDDSGGGLSISADGRYVAFSSDSSNLVPGDTNGRYDVFVYDRLNGQTERISVASDGTQGNNSSAYVSFPSISADGRYVAFTSYASNLVSEDTNEYPDIFVHDRLTGQTERVSVSSDGTQGNRYSYNPSISADGYYVTFESFASNLVLSDTNDAEDIFVRDLLTGQTSLVSVASDGTQGNSDSRWPSISADGRYVAFDSYASNLVLSDTNGYIDVFVHDRLTGETERVSVASNGIQGNEDSGGSAISADGRYVAFVSCTSNLVNGDTNGYYPYTDVFVRDRALGTTERVSVSASGEQGSFGSYSGNFSISADGRYVAFKSDASNLVPGDTNGTGDVFLRDRLLVTTERVSVSSSGVQGNNYSGSGAGTSISANGRYVVFGSDASNLVIADTNSRTDVFVRDRLGDATWTYRPGTVFGAVNPYEPPPSGTKRSMKGQLHCHWYDDNPTTGHIFTKEPYEVENNYKNMGYNFIALTEHNLAGHGLTPPTGAESANFVHIKNSEEVTADTHVLAVGVASEIPMGDPQSVINNIRKEGLAFIPHPGSLLGGSGLSDKDLYGLYDYQGMSIRTGASHRDWMGLWDAVLRHQKRIPSSEGGGMLLPGFAEDDYTPPGYYGPWWSPAGSTWILLDAYYNGDWNTKTNTQRSDIVKQALMTGRWCSYWVDGGLSWDNDPYPTLSVTVNQTDCTINVTSTNVLSKISFIGVRPGGWGSGELKVVENTNNASYQYSAGAGGSIYVRVLAEYKPHLWNKRLFIASNPIDVYPEGQVGAYGPARVSMPGREGGPQYATSAGLILDYVVPDDLPAAAPTLGYVRHVYNVSSGTGTCPPGAQLTLSYEGEDVLALGEWNLRVFRYNTATSAWVSLTTTPDTTNHELTAAISKLGLYTISAVSQADSEAPEVSFVLPGEGSTITGETYIMASASDNIGVAHTTFYLNDRQIASDGAGIDGWGATVDFSHYVSGTYTLKAEAEDLKGNRTETTRNVILQTNAVAPVVKLTTPLPSLVPSSGQVTIAGTVTDADGFVAGVWVEVNGTLAGVAEVAGGQWTCAMNASTFTGKYSVAVKAMDDYGNIGLAGRGEYTSDLNGDGKDDLVGLDLNGGIWYTTDKTSWIKIPGTLSKLTLGDLNGDGHGDIAGLSSTGKIYYTTNRNAWKNIPGIMSFLAAGDLNGNGTDDLAGISQTGKVYYTYNKTNWVNIPGSLASVAVGDLNKDGKDDVVGLSSTGKIYFSTDKATWKTIPGTLSKLVVGDFNGNGVDDIAGLNSSGKILYTTNKGVLWNNIPGTLASLAIGDFNGDGNDDIAGLSSAGKVYYTTNKTSWTNISGALANLTVGDLNGDGKDDIAGLGSSGSVWYTTNKSTWINIPGKLAQLYCAR